MLQAHELDNTKLNGGMDEKLDEGKYNDLTDGRYKKTIYLETWKGKTITVVIDLKHAVDTVKRQIEAKTKIPKDHQHLASRGKVLMDKKTLKGYYINGGETVEMTALLLGGIKKQKFQPNANERRRETKGKASEPYVDVSGLLDEKFESAASEEETVTTKQWMKSMMKEIKDRTDDISDFERTMTGMKFEMAEVKVNLDKMADAFPKIVDESQRRHQKIEELFKRINEDIRARDQKTEAKIAGIEKHIDAKIEETFTDLETRISAVENKQIMSKRKDLS